MIVIETNTMNINYDKEYIEYLNITSTENQIKKNMKLMIKNKISNNYSIKIINK